MCVLDEFDNISWLLLNLCRMLRIPTTTHRLMAAEFFLIVSFIIHTALPFFSVLPEKGRKDYVSTL